jgi:putative tricarboxylic transport membrane protein
MRKDLVASIGLLVIAAVYYAATLTIQQSTLEDEIGPTGLPTVLAALLAFIAVVIGARAFMTAPAAPVPDSDKDPEAPWPRAVGILLIGWLYLPVASIVGYPLALVTMLVAVALYEGMKPSVRMFVVAIGGAAFFWLLFEVVLGVRQPEGILF